MEDQTQNSSVTMRSNSDYAVVGAGTSTPRAPHAPPAATNRQQSYYEAVHRNGVPPCAIPINCVDSVSTTNLVEEITCPKEFYQVREAEDEQKQGINRKFKLVSRCPHILIIAICVISVCFAIVCCGLTLNMQKKIQELEGRFGQREPTFSAQGSVLRNEMCLPCDDIKQGPFPEDNEALSRLEKTIMNGTEICCARTPEQVSTLLDLFTKRKITGKNSDEPHGNCTSSSDKPPPLPPKTTISAHLQVGIPPRNNEENGMQPIKSWLSDRALTHLDGVELRKGRLIVPESGVYFVYSQAGFLIYYDPTKAVLAHEQSVVHKVTRYNARLPNNGIEVMMKSYTSQCWEQNKTYSRFSSNLGAAIKLEKNDELYVEVSDLSALEIDTTVTFFGMYKIR